MWLNCCTRAMLRRRLNGVHAHHCLQFWCGSRSSSSKAGMDAFMALEKRLRDQRRHLEESKRMLEDVNLPEAHSPHCSHEEDMPENVKLNTHVQHQHNRTQRRRRRRKAPREPSPEECCGSSCAQCVWTIYWNELSDYERSKHS